MAARIRVDADGFSDKGMVRQVNEDQFLVGRFAHTLAIQSTSLPLDDGALAGASAAYLLLVADGMGGHAAGKQASALAASAASRYLVDALAGNLTGKSADEKVADNLKAAVVHSEASLQDDVSHHPERLGMGTTLTMALVLWPNLHLAHVGDSRCYLLRDGKLGQLTTDHTLARQLADMGAIEKDQDRESRLHSILWNAIGGGESELRPQIIQLELLAGDSILLCSDGLTNEVTDDEIADVLRSPVDAAGACRALVERANASGGRDNATVVAARFVFAEPTVAAELDTPTAITPSSPVATKRDPRQTEPYVQLPSQANPRPRGAHGGWWSR